MIENSLITGTRLAGPSGLLAGPGGASAVTWASVDSAGNDGSLPGKAQPGFRERFEASVGLEVQSGVRTMTAAGHGEGGSMEPNLSCPHPPGDDQTRSLVYVSGEDKAAAPYILAAGDSATVLSVATTAEPIREDTAENGLVMSPDPLERKDGTLPLQGLTPVAEERDANRMRPNVEIISVVVEGVDAETRLLHNDAEPILSSNHLAKLTVRGPQSAPSAATLSVANPGSTDELQVKIPKDHGRTAAPDEVAVPKPELPDLVGAAVPKMRGLHGRPLGAEVQGAKALTERFPQHSLTVSGSRLVKADVTAAIQTSSFVPVTDATTGLKPQSAEPTGSETAVLQTHSAVPGDTNQLSRSSTLTISADGLPAVKVTSEDGIRDSVFVSNERRSRNTTPKKDLNTTTVEEGVTSTVGILTFVAAATLSNFSATPVTDLPGSAVALPTHDASLSVRRVQATSLEDVAGTASLQAAQVASGTATVTRADASRTPAIHSVDGTPYGMIPSGSERTLAPALIAEDATESDRTVVKAPEHFAAPQQNPKNFTYQRVMDLGSLNAGSDKVPEVAGSSQPQAADAFVNSLNGSVSSLLASAAPPSSVASVVDQFRSANISRTASMGVPPVLDALVVNASRAAGLTANTDPVAATEKNPATGASAVKGDGQPVVEAKLNAVHIVSEVGQTSVVAPITSPMHAAGVGQFIGSKGLAEGTQGLVTGGTAADPLRMGGDALGHNTILSTPNVLEVGVASGTNGWLKVRAEMDGAGGVSASMVTTTLSAAEALHKELPALSAYLREESVGISSLVVHRRGDSAVIAQDPTVNLGAGSSGYGTQEGSGGRSGASDSALQMAPTAEDAEPTSRTRLYQDSKVSTPAVLGSGSGGWLNVVA